MGRSRGLGRRRAADPELHAQRGPVAAWNGEKAVADGTDKTRFRDATGHGFDAVGPGVQSVPGGIHGGAMRFSGEGFLRVDDAEMFNLHSLTLSLWVKPETIAGRCGLISKRWDGGPHRSF